MKVKARRAVPPARGADDARHDTTLRVVATLFAELHAAGITYCHWKSNEHLRAALAGATDLDLLVERRSAPVLARILLDCGFKRFAPAPGLGYPGIEDHFALDPETGRLVHLHLHYRLTLGEPRLKGYRWPWEEYVLSTRSFDAGSGVYTADPHVELILLLVRSALKVRFRDHLAGAAGSLPVPDGTLRELEWLADRIVPGRLQEVGDRLIGAEATAMIPALIAGPLSAGRLRAFRRAIRPAPREHRMYGALDARLRRWRRELRATAATVQKRVSPMAIAPTKRVLPGGGTIVALIGADGTGKSTLVRETVRWLAPKLDVLSLYFGSGDGPASTLRRPLEAAASLGARAPLRALRRPLLRRGWNVLRYAAIAREKRVRLIRARRARDRGMVVLCDRYPQAQFEGCNDGPRLGGEAGHRSRILRAIAKREEAIYLAATAVPPDLVIRLTAPPEIAWARKPERSLESHVRRSEALRALEFPPGTRVVEIDASQAFDRVLLAVKRAVWESL